MRKGKREGRGRRAVPELPPLEGLGMGWLAGWLLLGGLESAQPQGIALPGFGIGGALQSRK